VLVLQGTRLLHGLASWAADQLAVAQAVAPDAAASLATSLGRVLHGSSGVVEADALGR
jgi:hypothetical protein